MMKRVGAIAAAALLLAGNPASADDTYPSRTVRMLRWTPSGRGTPTARSRPLPPR